MIFVLSRKGIAMYVRYCMPGGKKKEPCVETALIP